MNLEQHHARMTAGRQRQAAGHLLEADQQRDFNESVAIVRAEHTPRFWKLLHKKAQSGLDATEEAALETSRDLLAIDQEHVHRDLADLRTYNGLKAQGGAHENFKKSNRRLFAECRE